MTLLRRHEIPILIIRTISPDNGSPVDMTSPQSAFSERSPGLENLFWVSSMVSNPPGQGVARGQEQGRGQGGSGKMVSS